MDAPLQGTLPIVGPAALVVGPIFLCFELQGKPGHKGRHRSRLVIPKEAWTYPRGSGRFITEAGAKKIWIQQYPDPMTESHEKVIAEYAGLLMNRARLTPSRRPLALLVHAFREIPKSWSNRAREAAAAGRILPTSRPDEDNHLKLVKDALNGVAYVDDAQVVDGRCIKLYDPRPALRVEIREFIEP